MRQELDQRRDTPPHRFGAYRLIPTRHRLRVLGAEGRPRSSKGRASTQKLSDELSFRQTFCTPLLSEEEDVLRLVCPNAYAVHTPQAQSQGWFHPEPRKAVASLLRVAQKRCAALKREGQHQRDRGQHVRSPEHRRQAISIPDRTTTLSLLESERQELLLSVSEQGSSRLGPIRRQAESVIGSMVKTAVSSAATGLGGETFCFRYSPHKSKRVLNLRKKNESDPQRVEGRSACRSSARRGYSSWGCSPAEPQSASPRTRIISLSHNVIKEEDAEQIARGRELLHHPSLKPFFGKRCLKNASNKLSGGDSRLLLFPFYV